MVRTQVQVTEGQARELKRRAAERGVSMALLVREAVDNSLKLNDRSARWERALRAVGTASSDGRNVSEDHDRYLADAYSE